MEYEQEFKPNVKLSKPELEREIAQTFSDPDFAEELRRNEITDPDASQATAADIQIDQKGGTGLELIVAGFASKVAYDIWKKFILPKLETKYGLQPNGLLRKK